MRVLIEDGGNITQRTGDDSIDTMFIALRDSTTFTFRGWLLGLVATAIIEGHIAKNEAKIAKQLLDEADILPSSELGKLIAGVTEIMDDND